MLLDAVRYLLVEAVESPKIVLHLHDLKRGREEVKQTETLKLSIHGCKRCVRMADVATATTSNHSKHINGLERGACGRYT